MVNIAFVVAAITGCNHFFSGQDQFFSGLDHFLAVVTSLMANVIL